MTSGGWVDLSTDGVDGPGLAIDAEGDTLGAYFLSIPVVDEQPFSVADFTAALQALMPRGRVWPRDPDATQTQILAGLAPSLALVVSAGFALLVDAFPPTAVGLLPEWEATLGLPDPCAGPAPTLQIRQAQVLAKFISTGGQSVSFFVALAATLGYPITITEFTGANAHKWQVNAPTVSEIYFRSGHSAAGERLTDGGNAVLECVFNELRPAHTIVTFHYGP